MEEFFLWKNILTNFNYLKNDFMGVTFINPEMFIIAQSILFVIVLFLILYLIGEKIRLFFFRNVDNKSLFFFINIAIGYISVGTIIALLGFFSLLYVWILLIFIIATIFLAVYPLNSLRERLSSFFYVWKEYKKNIRAAPLLHIAILGFVLIGFLRLIPPETGVDALWYHTDYPRLYLKLHSMMDIDPRGKFYPAVVPSLADMYYVITQFFGLKDASRYIHYGFYFLVVSLFLVGFKKGGFRSYLYACLLFVTSTVVIRHTSTAYNEFQWILCWLIAVYIMVHKKNISNSSLILAGILFGGTLATKLWMLPFLAVFILYFFFIFYKNGIYFILKRSMLFTCFAFFVPLIWYVRAFIVTGNPLFPAFWVYETQEPYSIFSVININIFNFENLFNRLTAIQSFSPFAILGIFFLFTQSSRVLFKKNHPFFSFSISLCIIQFLIGYNWHRFVLPFYSIIVFMLGYGIKNMIYKGIFLRSTGIVLFFLFFLYYFLNAILTLPYGLGWADKNKYLTRILSRDNSSYYNYNYLFSKLITDNDIVASYGLWGFYYADFEYFYAEDVFKKENRSLDVLKDKGATKLLIKGGDIKWLCSYNDITDCNTNKYKLLAYYKFDYLPASQYLYSLIKDK